MDEKKRDIWWFPDRVPISEILSDLLVKFLRFNVEKMMNEKWIRSVRQSDIEPSARGHAPNEWMLKWRLLNDNGRVKASEVTVVRDDSELSVLRN